MMSIPLWTSTQFQNWKTDCGKHIASHQAFEVQDVYRPEQETFCVTLCEQHHYTWEWQKHNIVCTPPASDN
jgi:hypothetical protein